MNIGKRIKNLRNELNLSQEALAKTLKISRSALACYETDKRQVPHEVLISMAKYFKVTTDYLFGLED